MGPDGVHLAASTTPNGVITPASGRTEVQGELQTETATSTLPPSSTSTPVTTETADGGQSGKQNQAQSILQDFPRSGWLVFRPGADNEAFLGSLPAEKRQEAEQQAKERWPEWALAMHIFPAVGVAWVRDKRQRSIDRDPFPHAFHEAGHAIIARHHGWRIKSVDIQLRMFSAQGLFHPDRDCLGRTRLWERPSEQTEERHRVEDEKFMTYVLAGPVAESCFRPGRVRWRNHLDLACIRSRLWDYGHENEAAYLEALKARTKVLIKQLWSEVEILAKALVAHRTLTGEEADALLKNSTSQPLEHPSFSCCG